MEKTRQRSILNIAPPGEKMEKTRQRSKTWVMELPQTTKRENIQDHYTIGERLGLPGQFAITYLATHKKTGAKRAVKIISKARFSSNADRRAHFDQLKDEIDILSQVSHPNIVKMYEVFEDMSEIYIIMELCSGGELFDRIKGQGNYNEKEAARVLRMICLGIKYLHDKGIAHCDLKPDNFLFADPSDQAPLKIIDFGMSKFVQRRKYFDVICGTPYYVAPEVIKGRYSEHCDMWSLGVVMFVMLFGYPPFYADPEMYGDLTDSKIYEAIQMGFDPTVREGYGAHFPEALPCSDAAKDLMSALLELDAAKRLTAEEALQHKWLAGEAPEDPLLSKVLVNLKTFNANSKFKQGMLQLMTSILSEEDLDDLQSSFEKLDQDGTGVITMEKLLTSLKGVKQDISKQEVEKLLQMSDLDKNGVLSYDELVMATIHRKLNNKEERLWLAFCKLDLDGDGIITAKDIQKVMGHDNTTAMELLKEVDVKGDGNIDYDEFIRMWSDGIPEEDRIAPVRKATLARTQRRKTTIRPTQKLTTISEKQ